MREKSVRPQSKSHFAQRLATAPPSGRLFATLIFVLAFAFQSFVAQTHIHIPGAVDGVSTASAASPSKHDPAPDQSPQDDLGKCPLCQVAVAVGAAIGPSTIYFVEAFFGTIVVAPEPRSLAPRLTLAHVWNSRAPPR